MKEVINHKIQNYYNLKNQLLELVINGVESILANGYQNEEEMTTHFSNRFLSILKENEKRTGKREIISHVCYPKISKLTESKAVAEFVLVSKGKVADKVVDDKSLGEAILVLDENKWKIDAIKTKNKKQHLVINNKKQKKKIYLIYTSLSGSNTYALFQKVPDRIKYKHEVELVKQEATSEYVEKVTKADILIITEGNVLTNKPLYNPNQIIIDLWHGFPLKALGFKDKGEINKEVLSHVWENIDFITSYSTLFNNLMNKCIQIEPEKYHITGQPRNDLLITSNGKSNLESLLEKDFSNKHLVLYMPTYRYRPWGNRNEGNRSWNNLFDFNQFESTEFIRFLKNNNIELIVKLHPCEEERFFSQIFEKYNNINFLTKELLETKRIDLYELLNGVDVLITDYSSIYFDTLLVDMPVIFTPTDLDEYTNGRGFLLNPYEDWTPGPKVKTQQDLQIAIERSLKEETYYFEERKNLRKLVHQYSDSESSERVWDFIKKII